MRLRWIVATISIGILLFIGLFLYANFLAQKLLLQQTTLVHFYAEALRYAAQAPEACLDEFFWEYLFPDRRAGSRLFLVPMVLTNEKGKVLSHNLHELREKLPATQSLEAFLPLLHADTVTFPPVTVQFSEGRVLKIYYGEPLILRQLRWMPIFSAGLIAIAAILWLIFLYAAYQYRQNRLWIGLARETAHQIGTPLSGLLGAVEMLKESPELLPRLLAGMESDIQRLEEIADRFSKIGAAPQLKKQPLLPIIKEVVAYFQQRVPENVQITLEAPETPIVLPLNAILLKWVIENLIRNSLNALPPEGGRIHVRIHLRRREVWIDVEDTGKGIPPAQWEVIFRPGFSTKRGGWGMGLSLARRVVEEYHGGEIFVYQSGLGQGTTIRIRLSLEGKTSLGQKLWRSILRRLRRFN